MRSGKVNTSRKGLFTMQTMKTMKPMKATKTNQKWFLERLAERQMSLRQLAKKIELDPSAVSLTFRGMRKMTLGEANSIAELLGLPVTEVIRQAGIAVADDVKGVRLFGYVDAKSAVKNLPAGTARRVAAPADVPHDGLALQIRAANHFYDGWMVFVGPENDTPALFMDRICVITLANNQKVFGTLRRGYEEGHYNVLPLLDTTGQNTLDDQEVDSVFPVLWMRPQ
jgi:hypothetical protein